MRKTSSMVAVSVALVGAMQATAAYAAEQEQDEIIVTATRRETLLQQTPVSVTALPDKVLQEAGVFDTRALSTQVPGLTITGDAGLGNLPITVRGIGSAGNGIGGDDPVALYVDGVYLGRPSSSTFDLVDIERVEVLRGPQGTLYGRNATGGAISFVTKRPRFDESEQYFAARYGENNSVGVRGYITAPINDNLALKIAGGYSSADGYAKNVFFGTLSTPQQGTQHPFGSDLRQVRVGLAFRASRLEGMLSADYGSFRSENPMKDIRGFLTGVAPNQYAYVDPDIYSTNSPTFIDRSFSGASLNLTYDLSDSVQLASVSGYRKSEYHDQSDSDGTPALVFSGNWMEDQKQLSQEVRLTSTGNSPWQWIVGGFFFNEKSSWAAGTAFAGNFTYRNTSNETNSYAVFGELSYQVTEQFKAGVGLRYSDERKSFTYAQSIGTGTANVPDPSIVWSPTQRNKVSANALTPRFVLEYKVTDDVFSFLNISRGFKSGGFNLVSVDDFAPEFIWNYEAGIKAESFGGRLRTNLSAFYADYTNLQVRIPVGPGQVSVRNAASAEIKGAELEFVFLPTDSLKFSGNVAYLDATYAKFQSPIYDVNPASPTYTQVIGFADYSGNTLNRAPGWKAFVAAEQVLTLGSRKLTLRAEGAYEGRLYFSETNAQLQSREPVTIFNLRAFYDMNDKMRMTFAVENVGDKRYLNGVAVIAGTPLGSISRGRSWFAELSYRF